MTAVAELLRQAASALKEVSDSPRLDAELLLCHALNKDKTFLFTWPDHEPGDIAEVRFNELLDRRGKGEPVAYLLGYREFYGHRFMVSPATLIPRPDTELLVETALSLLPEEAAMTVADLGTGTGAIGISLALARPQWTVLASDCSRDIVDLAERNARALKADNVRLLQSDWLAAIDGPLDAVLSNPPYIAGDDPHLDQGDVRFEPRSALVASDNGLDDLREIAVQSSEKLAAGGWLLMEHGFDQGAAVRQLLLEAGFDGVETRQDLAGHERCTLGRKP